MLLSICRNNDRSHTFSSISRTQCMASKLCTIYRSEFYLPFVYGGILFVTFIWKIAVNASEWSGVEGDGELINKCLRGKYFNQFILTY